VFVSAKVGEWGFEIRDLKFEIDVLEWKVIMVAEDSLDFSS